jgi:hypothetical protein
MNAFPRNFHHRRPASTQPEGDSSPWASVREARPRFAWSAAVIVVISVLQETRGNLAENLEIFSDGERSLRPPDPPPRSGVLSLR